MDEQEFTTAMILESLSKCFKVYGIEGTEQKLLEIYKHSPKLLSSFLFQYRQVLKYGWLNE